jgi:hypothetical protein
VQRVRWSRAHFTVINEIFPVNNFFSCLNSPRGPISPYCWGFEITLRHTTLGRTPLDEWLSRRRDLYLTTYNTHRRKHPFPRRDSNLQSQQANGRRHTPYTWDVNLTCTYETVLLRDRTCACLNIRGVVVTKPVLRFWKGFWQPLVDCIKFDGAHCVVGCTGVCRVLAIWSVDLPGADKGSCVQLHSWRHGVLQVTAEGVLQGQIT